MNTDLTREQISALVDGELDTADTEAVLASLHQAEGRVAWELYHQAGDALRWDNTGHVMSSEFSRRLFARLEQEPIVIAPQAVTACAIPSVQQHANTILGVVFGQKLRRFALPGMVAAAAVATVAFITTPQMMVADSAPTGPQIVLAAPQPSGNSGLGAQVISGPSAAQAEAEEVVLRDPRIDDYLFAHQRFSPSVYSTAQFARSATFTSDLGK